MDLWNYSRHQVYSHNLEYEYERISQSSKKQNPKYFSIKNIVLAAVKVNRDSSVYFEGPYGLVKLVRIFQLEWN